MPDQPTSNWLLSTVVTFLSGGLVGAVLNHFLSSARDRRIGKNAIEDAREARKRDFLSFLGGFRSEAERIFGFEFRRIFRSKVHQFRSESAKVRSDLSRERQAPFDKAVAALCQLSDNEAGQTFKREIGRTPVTEAIDAVIRSLD